MSKPVVDHDLCIGCGTCEALCPAVFKLVDGKSVVIADSCGECDCDNAVNSCPVSAISLAE